MSSLVPIWASRVASFTKSSIDRSTCLPRMSGIAQNEHGRLQPSAILSKHNAWAWLIGARHEFVFVIGFQGF
jgi:hypothetical protein